MKRIKLVGVDDDNHYFLLESKELPDHEISDLVKGFVDEGDIIKIIREGGVTASANQFLIMQRDVNHKLVRFFNVEDESDFISLED
ncbi:hypothetical protein [Elizabethkingia anophelis]|uniref:hypothetical protein n=1 Tax=Elizabethkingia anophelis TaxID=1117645 RepID=UPI000442B172|nr:hypothetical protein [Elizabethkingia anophelis]AVF47857.1 hypothetical protein AL491_07080 [Elizabethkingia anophelis]AVF51849.1 hypothetical protein AL492_09490 [Elizabethkingia anophelis]MBG0505453.1 hypothetical protein [Elizabethkingia anophelis]MCT3663829.1 hypothetical protein [Elizabethkingia anophelis]MCT4074314.1 hypothetical protein [Elizabethkingia anophelis]